MTTRVAAFLVVGLTLAMLVNAPRAASQTSLGTVSSSTPLTSCPNRGFVSGVGMTCYTAVLTGCPGNDDLAFDYGVAPPSGPPRGTIVFFAGDGGEHAADGPDQTALLSNYVSAGYQLVQIAWGSGQGMQDGTDWEYTNVNGGTNPSSILNAACRPASFLNWVRNGSGAGVGKGIWGNYGGGMCAQGHSAGSGALAYALAWYNAGAATATNGQGYLDKAVFTAGPVFSDIKKGCEVPNNQYTLMCESPGQVGCRGWPAQDPPGAFLEYATGYKNFVNSWSGNNTAYACANNNHATTYDNSWFQMSILYNLGTQQPSFNYPMTTISAWLCASTAPGVTVNNAGSQGQLYWAQFTNTSQAGGSLSVNAVVACPTTEGALGGTVGATGDLGSADVRSKTYMT